MCHLIRGGALPTYPPRRDPLPTMPPLRAIPPPVSVDFLRHIPLPIPYYFFHPHHCFSVLIISHAHLVRLRVLVLMCWHTLFWSYWGRSVLPCALTVKKFSTTSSLLDNVRRAKFEICSTRFTTGTDRLKTTQPNTEDLVLHGSHQTNNQSPAYRTLAENERGQICLRAALNLLVKPLFFLFYSLTSRQDRASERASE